jgi:single-strand DNA-binding protein
VEQNEYENDDGDKKVTIQIVVDEIAPSLRWATATVEKVQRKRAND